MRNLKLGDNLSGKTLYFNFPETFQDFLNNGYSPATVNLFTTDSGYSFDAVLSQNGGSLQYQVICMENGSIYKNIERVYINSDAYGLEMNTSSVNLPDDFGKVISIDSTTNFIQNIQIDPKIVIIVDTQPKSSPSENKKEYILYTEELNSNGDISDLLEINYNQVKLTRKIGIDENGNKYVLEEPIIEEFELEIVLFKGNNYIYVEETDYSKLTLEYYTDNPANEEFARVKEVEALIKVTDEINSEVKKKVDDKEVISVINQSAEQITVKGNRFVVESTNFKLTADGTCTAKNLNLKGGSIEIFSEESSPQFKLNGNSTKCEMWSGALRFLEKDVVYDTGVEVTDSYGYYGKGIMILNTENNSFMLASDFMQFNNRQSGAHTYISASELQSPVITQLSIAEKKKNLKKFLNALPLIMNSDIYSYNLKFEKNNEKKHIGLVIGNGYNCADAVINSDRTGIDQYSMISVAWQAIKDQQEMI